MKSHLMFGFLTVILLLGQVYPVLGQSNDISNHVVINEVETNPPGDDSKLVAEWVELFNPTQNAVDVSGWTIGATTGIKSIFKIPDGTKIPSGGFLVYTSGPLWLPDVSAVIQLKNKNGTAIDETPPLTDTQDSSSSWQRKVDGFDTHSSTDWVFKLQTPGSSNGKLATSTIEESLSVTVLTDKTNYLFGETIKITGQVSKKVFEPNLKYFPAKVNLIITGPSGYKNVISLYPEYNLSFKTELKTDRVLGVPEGDFKISAEYGGATSQAEFTISEKPFVAPQKEAPTTISLFTDKLEYIPGQMAILNGNVSKVIPLVGLKFKIFNPNTFQVYDGTLFPDGKGKFSVKLMVDPVTPVFGRYDVVATYDKETAKTSYQVVKEIKEDKLISLTTDKSVYGLGDTVIITGRSNKVWVPSFTIEIMQTFLKAVKQGVELPNTYVVKSFVNLAGDGTFKYEFKIPQDKDRYGDYRVRISEFIGTAEVNFKVVENPETYVAEQKGPLSIWTDKSTYNIGDPFIISGKAPEPKERSRLSVEVLITKEGGEKIVSKPNQKVSATPNQQPVVYSFTGTPDGNGNFEIKGNLYRNIFEKGTYVLKAKYGHYEASTSFAVVDSLDLGEGLKIIASTDKQVYGAGDTIHLKGEVSTFTAEGSYTIILTDPDGNKIRNAANIDNGMFSWSWAIPNSTKEFGVYRLTVSGASLSTEVFFKVSKDPKSETPPVPLEIKTDKPAYRSLETLKVIGHAIRKFSGTEGNAPVNVRPEILIKDSSNKQVYNTFVDMNSGGDFQTSIVLSLGIFKTGDYKITAKYLDAKSQSVFKIEDQFASTDTKLYLIVATDKEKYLLGETVKLTGRISKLVYVFNDVDISVQKEDKSSTLSRYPELRDSATGFQTAKFDSSGAFSYEYKIPENAALGNYLITAHTKFDKVTLKFEVVSQLPPQEVKKPAPETPAPEVPSTQPTEPTEKTVPSSKKLIDTVNRISDSFIPIDIAKKTVEGKTVNPKIFDGLLRVNPGDESDVNMKVSLEDGTCIIGPDSDCLVTKSTRSTGSIYQVVKIGDTNFKVRYSGPDVRMEEFTILPEDPNGVMSDAKWNVEIIKKDQTSRFYYKISYVAQG